MSKSYIPSSDDKFLDWARLLNTHAAANHSSWGVESPAAWIAEPLAAFQTAMDAADNPNHGKIDTLRKRESKKILEKACRTYVQGFIAHNPRVSNADRETMGLTVYDVIPTNVPPPAMPAHGDIHYPAAGLVEIRNIRAVGEHPDTRADYGVRIYYGILGEPSESDRFRVSAEPRNGDDLPHSVFTRQKKHRFDFSGDSGKAVFFCLRPENSKGQPGPWGQILKTYIP